MAQAVDPDRFLECGTCRHGGLVGSLLIAAAVITGGLTLWAVSYFPVPVDRTVDDWVVWVVMGAILGSSVLGACGGSVWAHRRTPGCYRELLAGSG